jgi:hypothetical protein
MSWQIAKVKCPKLGAALLYYRMHHQQGLIRVATEISKVMTNCPRKMCKLEIPLLYSRVDHKHIMLMSTKGTSILLQNASTINT